MIAMAGGSVATQRAGFRRIYLHRMRVRRVTGADGRRRRRRHASDTRGHQIATAIVCIGYRSDTKIKSLLPTWVNHLRLIINMRAPSRALSWRKFLSGTSLSLVYPVGLANNMLCFNFVRSVDLFSNNFSRVIQRRKRNAGAAANCN